MVTLINTNPLGAVEVPDLRRYGHYHLDAGEEFDVPREVADRLLEQAENYAEKKTAAKKAAADTEKQEG